MPDFRTETFPSTRVATIDVCEMGKRKHHITALLEFDVTFGRQKIRNHNKQNRDKASFTGWIISTIGSTLKQNETAASYLKGKRKRIIFNDINVSMLVEKLVNNQKVPIPLIIEKANEKSVVTIAQQIMDARNQQLNDRDMVLYEQANRFEKMYARLPGFFRRMVWTYLLKHPEMAYQKMGNVALTSVGMIGKGSGWFIPIAIHPICFGVSSITKKPVMMHNEIKIREILNMTILFDHDVIDGAPMARFISDLSRNIENGINL